MNIFFLHPNPSTSADFMYGRHRLKMLLESTQLLCGAVRRCAAEPFSEDVIYEETHMNHPCAVWTRASGANFFWLYDHASHLSAHYLCQYKKKHACFKVLQYIATLRLDFDEFVLTEPPQCMHEKYRCPNVIVAYRQYYLAEKSHVFSQSWGDARVWGPEWVSEVEQRGLRFLTGYDYTSPILCKH